MAKRGNRRRRRRIDRYPAFIVDPVQTLEQHPGRQADYWAVGCVIVTFCGEGHCKISREVNQ